MGSLARFFSMVAIIQFLRADSNRIGINGLGSSPSPAQREATRAAMQVLPFPVGPIHDREDFGLLILHIVFPSERFARDR
jgi:hypothetical protein